MSPSGGVRQRRRLVAVAALTVFSLGILLLTVSPTTTWWRLRKDTARTSQELAEVRAEAAEVEREQARLRTRDEIVRRAREELGYVQPGEEAYNVLPAPADPIGLPDGWPFTGVERALGAR